MAVNPFHPTMTHFTLPLHATREELIATALTGRMGDENVLRWWVARVRETIADMHLGARAIAPGGSRTHVPDHLHTVGAHDLAAGGVPMLAATGPSVFEFDDLAR